MSYGIVLAITHENDPDFRPNFLVFLDQLWRQKPQVHSYYPLPQTPPYVVMIMDICSVLWDTNYKWRRQRPNTLGNTFEALARPYMLCLSHFSHFAKLRHWCKVCVSRGRKADVQCHIRLKSDPEINLDFIVASWRLFWVPKTLGAGASWNGRSLISMGSINSLGASYQYQYQYQ